MKFHFYGPYYASFVSFSAIIRFTFVKQVSYLVPKALIFRWRYHDRRDLSAKWIDRLCLNAGKEHSLSLTRRG